MSAFVMIFACSVFLTAALAFGWSAGGFLFAGKPIERLLDYLVLSVSLLLMFALYQVIGGELEFPSAFETPPPRR